MSDGRIPLDRLTPPLQQMGPHRLMQAPRDANTLFEAAGDSIALGWVGQMFIDNRARKEAGVPGYDPTNRSNIQEGYNVYRDEDFSGLYPYFDEFQGTFSHKEFLAQKYKIRINNDLRHAVEDYPVTRFLAEGIVDPINLIPVPLALGKGFWKGAQRAAVINAPLIAGTEAVRVSLDPTADPIEILYSTMGSMLFTGVIGGLAGSYKGPIGKMTVSDALDIIVPLERPITAEAGMFNWVRFVGKGAFRRIHNSLRSTDNMGGFKSAAHADRVSVERNVGDGVDDLVTMKVDNLEVGTATVRGGDTLQINHVQLPENLQGQGIGTALYKSLIKYAQDNGLKVVSDTQVSEAAAGVWKKLSDEGFNIKRNEATLVDEADGFGNERSWQSDNGMRPIFEVEAILKEQAAKMPESLKADHAEFTQAVRDVNTKLAAIRKRLAILNKQLAAMDNNNGGRQTKQKQRIKEAEDDLVFATGEKNIFDGQLLDTNTKMALMLDEQIAKDWDLLPTGYNKILANTDQFPFWQLMKSPVSEAVPEIGRRMQMYALRMASTPGLNTKAHVLGHAAGRSVESSAPVHFAGFVSAKKMANKLYLQYLDYGSDTGGFSHYGVDQMQRTVGAINKAKRKLGIDESRVAPENKMTFAQWDNEITLAILQRGDHKDPLVAEAASHYIKWIKEIGDAARKEGLFATQKNITRQIERIKIEREKAMKTMWHTVNEDGSITVREGQTNSLIDEYDLEIGNLESKLEAYVRAGSDEIGGTGWIHRIWRKDNVIAKEAELKAYIEKEFTANPHEGFVEVRIDDELVKIDMTDPDAIRARVDEAYSSILKEAEHGGDGEFVVTSTDKADWLYKRKAVLEEQAQGASKQVQKEVGLRVDVIDRKLERLKAGDSTNGGPSALIGRRLDLDDAVLMNMNVIETSVTAWGQHYAMRIAPLIETSRIFGDARATKEIGEIYSSIKRAARDAIRDGDLKKGEMLNLEAERTLTASQDLRDIVQGIYGIPDNPEAITGRVLRLLRNLNLISAMGRSTLMAFGDIGNVVVSQGFTNTFRQLAKHFRKSMSDGSIKMMEDEVELAGSAIEVVMAQRFHQLTELGGSAPRTGSTFNKVERFAQNAGQRFFLHNMMSPWTDMMRKVSGSMLQSKIISNALEFRAGTISPEDIKVMARIGINKDNALRMLDEWENAGSLRHENMFIANTEGWRSEELKMLFRSAMNTEIGRMVPTPGAADKPKGLLKSEWWKVIGQYRGFSIGATHRIMSAGLQTNSANKYSGIASMIGIAMMVDAWKRPDYIETPIEEAVLRAVELSGVTGIILDLNDTIERASAGSIGLRPAMGMDIRERDPNWANRLGTTGAVPNQLMTLLYAIGSDDASTADRTRALRYMIPYNNLIWWNEYVNRMQRATTDFIED